MARTEVPVNEVEDRELIVSLAARGYKPRKIMLQLGGRWSLSSIERALKDAAIWAQEGLAEHAVQRFAEHDALLQELKELICAFLMPENATGVPLVPPDDKLIAALIKVMERQARLLGLDKGNTLQISQPVTDVTKLQDLAAQLGIPLPLELQQRLSTLEVT